MAMTNRANIKRDGLIMSTLDDLVPQDHLVRTLEATIDWKFIYPLVKSLYSNFGRRSIDPVVLFKMIFLYLISYDDMKRISQFISFCSIRLTEYFVSCSIEFFDCYII